MKLSAAIDFSIASYSFLDYCGWCGCREDDCECADWTDEATSCLRTHPRLW